MESCHWPCLAFTGGNIICYLNDILLNTHVVEHIRSEAINFHMEQAKDCGILFLVCLIIKKKFNLDTEVLPLSM